MSINDIYETSLLFSVNGEKCACVFHAQEITPPPSVDPEQDCADAFHDYIWAKLKLVMSNDAILQLIRCRKIFPTPGGGILLPVNVAGSVAQDTLPPNSCAVMSWYSANLTQSGRGRTHIPGIPDTFQGDGLIEAAEVSKFGDFGDTLCANISGSGSGVFRPGIWSNTFLVFNAITNYILRPNLSTLRSRRMLAP